MSLSAIKHTVSFNTTAVDVFTILTDARRHSSFIGEETDIEPVENTTFQLLGGYVQGKNVVLERGRKMVGTFALNHPEWPENQWSEVVISLVDISDGSCNLELIHVDIPHRFEEEITTLWEKNYWPSLAYYINR